MFLEFIPIEILKLDADLKKNIETKKIKVFDIKKNYIDIKIVLPLH